MPMPFNNAVMTNSGAALLTKAQAGECKIEFTKMAIGDGAYSEEEKTIAALQARTDLKDHKNDYSISGCDIYTEKSVKVTALISNMDPQTYEPLITDGFYINEVGLYGREKSDPDTEVLYSIAITSGEQGDYMPPYNGSDPAEITQDFYVTVDNSAEVSVESSGAVFTAEQAAELKKELEEKIEEVNAVLAILNSADSRNSAFRGKDLTDEYTLDELSSMVKSGEFTDIYLGDHIKVEMTTSLGGTETVDLVVADFDPFYGRTDEPITEHHIALVPRNAFVTLTGMNDTNTTEGGYIGSKMYTEILPIYEAALKEIFGDHMMTHRRWLTNAVTDDAPSAAGANFTGSATAGEWTSVRLCQMSEPMAYGTTAGSSSLYDVSVGSNQFALFRFKPEYLTAKAGEDGDRCGWWLCAVASSRDFCDCSNNGAAGTGNASNSIGVRPYFLFS